MARDDFFDVNTVERRTSEGPVRLPILYRDASVVQVFFPVDLGAAAACLDGTGLVPARFAGGKAVAGLVFFEYRDTSIGPYNEAGLALAVYPAGRAGRWPTLELPRLSERRTLGFHILNLPVSTAVACAAGRELWGYPKFVADIPFKLGAGAFECSVRSPDDDGAICTLSGPASAGLPLRGIDLVLYSQRDETALRTVVDVRASMRTAGGRGVALAVGAGDHPMARNLRALGMDGAGPIAVQTTDRFQSRLHEGRPL